MHLRRRARRLIGLAAAVLLATGIVALAGSPASAHANLVATNPSSGSELDEPPGEVRLRFSERITLAPEGVILRDSNGAEVSTEPAAVAPEDPTAAVLPVPADLPDGSYVVSFRVVSADSHPVAGAIVFGVGVAAGSLADVDIAGDDPVVTGVFAAARWTSYAGLALLAGGMAMFVLCWPGGWASRRARKVLLTGWLASLAGGVSVLVLQGPYSAGRTLAGVADPELLSATMDTDYGRYMVVRLALVAAAGGLLLLAGRPQWHQVRTVGAVLLGIGLPATWLGTGHANTSDNPLDIGAEVLHLIAMSTWFGGLALLAICLLPRSAALPPAEVTGAVRRFSRLATTAVVVLLLTGVYVAWRRVGTLEALLGTPYGRLLAFKLATLGVLLWLGSMSRSVVQRRYAAAEAAVPDGADLTRTSRSKRRTARQLVNQESSARAQLRGSVRLESGTAVAVLAVASVLVATPPGVVVTAGEELDNTAGPVLAEAPLEEGSESGVQVLVDPAWVGENRVIVEVVQLVDVQAAQTVAAPQEQQEPQFESFAIPMEVPEVRAAFVLPGSDLGPLPVELTKTGPGVYRALHAQLPTPGEWRLDVTVRTSEIDSSTVQIPVPVA